VPEAKVTATVDVWTIVAIAIVAYVFASVIHEGIGHGGACVLTGGKPLAISTVHCECDKEGRLVAAGGTIANIIAGVVCWIASRLVRRVSHLRYFLWLLMTINLMDAGGYFLFSGIGNIGDWAVVIHGLQPVWLWRIALTLIGLVSYLLFVWTALLEMRPFLGPEGHDRVQRAKKLALVPYLTGGILSCVAGLPNPVGMILVAMSAAAASFGGTSGLAWMWQLVNGRLVPNAAFEMPSLSRSRAWIIAASTLAVAFIALLGPGLKFHQN
jgi:hypothetical protein